VTNIPLLFRGTAFQPQRADSQVDVENYTTEGQNNFGLIKFLLWQLKRSKKGSMCKNKK
jgi:uncharacterized protein YggU (UPF0235/DUF167 family)